MLSMDPIIRHPDFREEYELLLEELERLEAVADVADEAYQNNPESEEAENAFYEAYQEEYNAFIIVSNQIAEFAGIDAKTARAMVQGKREELKQILA